MSSAALAIGMVSEKQCMMPPKPPLSESGALFLKDFDGVLGRFTGMDDQRFSDFHGEARIWARKRSICHFWRGLTR